MDFEREMEEKMRAVFKKPIAFTIATLNVEPTPEQAKFLHSRGKRTAIEGKELSGRTTIMMAKALWLALNEKGITIAFVVKDEYSKKRLMLYLQTLTLNNWFFKERIITNQNGMITFDTGSRLIVTTGLEEVQKKLPDYLFFDDAGQHPQLKKLDLKKAGNIIISYNPEVAQLEVEHNDLFKFEPLMNNA